MNRTLAILLLSVATVVFSSPVLRADDDKKVQILANDQMKFDVINIDAAAGQKVTVTFTNAGKLPKIAMAHNLVFLKAGTDVSAFAMAALTHQAEGYMPPDQADKILAATKLLGPGESDTVTFTAPAAGTYDFICTFPGHALAGMRGTLNVK